MSPNVPLYPFMSSNVPICKLNVTLTLLSFFRKFFYFMKYFLLKLSRFCLGAYYSLQFTVAVPVPRSLKWLSCNKRQSRICNARNFNRTCTFPHVTQKKFRSRETLVRIRSILENVFLIVRQYFKI